MRKLWRLAALWAFSLLACEGEAWLPAYRGDAGGGAWVCEAGDKRCKVGELTCVVGYDGDCPWGQVCYGGKGALKGKMGTCEDGQFDAKGQLTATVVLQKFVQAERWVWPVSHGLHAQSRECFWGCPLEEEAFPLWGGFGFGKAPATLEVSVRGPHAEAEQLKVAVRGVEHEGCVKSGHASGWPLWECHFAEGWAGANTREALELKLWTESGQEVPWVGSFWVDTQPLELVLEAQLRGDFLEVSVNKKGVARRESGFSTKAGGAWLEEVRYSKLEVIRNNMEISVIVDSEAPSLWPLSTQADHQLGFFNLQSSDTFEVYATVSARDSAGNEVTMEALETRLVR